MKSSRASAARRSFRQLHCGLLPTLAERRKTNARREAGRENQEPVSALLARKRDPRCRGGAVNSERHVTTRAEEIRMIPAEAQKSLRNKEFDAAIGSSASSLQGSRFCTRSSMSRRSLRPTGRHCRDRPGLKSQTSFLDKGPAPARLRRYRSQQAQHRHRHPQRVRRFRRRAAQPLWMDVLENGPSSIYAPYLDTLLGVRGFRPSHFFRHFNA